MSLAIEAAPTQLRLRVRFTVFADHVAHKSPRSGLPGESQRLTSTPFFPAGGAGRGIPARRAGATPATSGFGAEDGWGDPATGPGPRRRNKSRACFALPPVGLNTANRIYSGHGASGRRRVRGKDCVHLLERRFAIPMNSFPPAPADTGHERPARTRGQERSSSCLPVPFLRARFASAPISIN